MKQIFEANKGMLCMLFNRSQKTAAIPPSSGTETEVSTLSYCSRRKRKNCDKTDGKLLEPHDIHTLDNSEKRRDLIQDKLIIPEKKTIEFVVIKTEASKERLVIAEKQKQERSELAQVPNGAGKNLF